MSRRRAESIRKVIPDPIYNSELVTKLINQIMLHGKRSTASKMVYKAFGIVEAKLGQNSLEVFEGAVQNISPHLEVKSRRVGGATYQVPVEVRLRRRVTLALRWLHEFAKKRKGNAFAEKLADEIMDALQGRGSAVKKKEDTHRMAEANKAFSHFRF